MEGIRAIAIAYYDRATKGEKDMVRNYFKKFDTKGNGKITLQQYKSVLAGEHLSDETIFRKLDANGDGTLDFDEVVCLYYMDKKLGLHKCAGCRDLLVGAYFSCLRCVEDEQDSECRLCCTCYHLGDFNHRHSLGNFLDQHTMAKVLKTHTPDARQDQRKKEQGQLREIAKSYYLASSQEVQDLAHNFFNSMDMDGDGKVELSEFLEFMKEEGYTRMQNPKIFKELDLDSNGTLDFDEVRTAYYIIKSGRPFCDLCESFIRGIYFSCLVCYRDPSKSFNLCCNCYCSKKCDHKHDGRTQFLDNFALLEALKDTGPNKTDQQNKAKGLVPPNSQATKVTIPSNKPPRSLVPQTGRSPIIPSNTQARSQVPTYPTTVPAATSTNNVIYNTYVVNPPPPVAQYYHNAIIHRPHWIKWENALKALEAAVAIGSLATMSTCTIM